MTKLKAWLNLFLFFCFVFRLIESTPSLLSSVKARNRMQLKNTAKTLNWASSHATSSWNQMSSPYASSYYSPYQQQEQQQQQQYLMAPPPPPISPYSLSANDQSSSRFKSKALKLVGPTVKKYFDEHHLGVANPMMRQKKRMEAMERAFPELSKQQEQEQEQEHLEEDKLNEPIDYEVQTGLRAANGNKTLNIHRFRPGKWTNIFSGKRRNFKLAGSDDSLSNSNGTSAAALNDDDIAQIDLIKTTTTLPTSTARSATATATNANSVNSTTTVAKFRPGARRRYGYKNFKKIQANESISVNDTQLRSGVNGMFYRNLKGNRNMSDNLVDDLIDGNGNRTLRRPFGSRLYEKQLFRSYIQKKKLIQLLQNETDTGLDGQSTTDLTKLNDLYGSNLHAVNSTAIVFAAESKTETESEGQTEKVEKFLETTSTTTTTSTTHKPKRLKLRKLSIKLPKTDTLNPKDSAVAMIASQPDAFDSRYSDLPHLIKRVSDNQNRIAAIYNKSKFQ